MTECNVCGETTITYLHKGVVICAECIELIVEAKAS